MNFNWDGIDFPTPLDQIDILEKNNPDYVVFVFGYEEGKIRPLRPNKKYDPKDDSQKIIDLLLLSNGRLIITEHCINDINKLYFSQAGKNKCKEHPCRRCFNVYHSKKSLVNHLELCSKHGAVLVEMPVNEDGTPQHLQYKTNIQRQMKHPWCAYADFEIFNNPISTCSPDERKSFTKQYQKHTPSGFGLLIKCLDDKLYPPKFIQYTAKSPDEDVAQKFVDTLEAEIINICQKVPANNKKFPKKKKWDCDAYKKATHCHICGGVLGDDKVWDHCHSTGKYRGAAHFKCNLAYQVPKYFPVFFPNLAGYDSHLFIKNLGVTEGNIKCIPNNEEKYISFSKEIVIGKYIYKKDGKEESKRKIRLLDSFKLMSSSLAKLADNLPRESFKNLTAHYVGESVDELSRIGNFPYESFDSFDKLNATQLPPEEAFYSKLTDTYISDDNYAHAQKVWVVYGMKTMRD